VRSTISIWRQTGRPVLCAASSIFCVTDSDVVCAKDFFANAFHQGESPMTLNLTIPKTMHTDFTPRITVIGVGGGGTNAVDNMIQLNLQGVEFVVANTDAQQLMHSRSDRRIQLGPHLTQGLGAGAKPEIGRLAAEEAADELARHLDGAHMVFITAGMGGGTGTGAAPVIARMARERGILTVGVVTKPFTFEGARCGHRRTAAIRRHVDRHPQPESFSPRQ
jgi:cell division protein FtsZ